MADPSIRRARRSGGVVSSRSGSARSSAVFEDYLSPLPPGHHSLRSSCSRFSLNELFSSTRREYEFGFDDTASAMDRSTVASEALWDVDQDDAVLVSGHALLREKIQRSSTARHPRRDYYELLCLPKDPLLSPVDIRRAYWRLVRLFEPERQPVHLRQVAAFYLEAIQLAFEALIEPYRRINYDLLSTGPSDLSETEDGEDEDYESTRLGQQTQYEDHVKEAYLDLAEREIQTCTNLGLQLGPWGRNGASRGGTYRLRAIPMDLSLTQSNTFPISGVWKTLARPRKATTGKISEFLGASIPLDFADPTVTITGSVQGILLEPPTRSMAIRAGHPTGMSSPHQCPFEPEEDPSGLALGITLRQGLFSRAGSLRKPQTTWDRRSPDSIIEQDLTLLPHVSATTRLAHAFNVPKLDQPLNAEVCIQNFVPGIIRNSGKPRVGLALHHQVKNGTAFVVVDSGDWKVWPETECRELSMLEKQAQALRIALLHQANAVRIHPPTVEVGFTRGTHDLGLQSGRPFTRASHRGPDYDLEGVKTGSWTVSTAATTSVLAGYLRYGRDLFSPMSELKRLAIPAGNLSHRHSGLRAEVELGAGVGRGFDNFLAVRLLKRVGRFSKVGAEVSSTATTVCLSLYWSRLGQRLSFPLLLGDLVDLPQKHLLFLAALAPLMLLALGERNQTQRRQGICTAQKRMSRTRTVEELQEQLARRRAEADDLTAILSSGAELLQNSEFRRNGLAILSAKYGVKDAAPEEVADVTVAVAALVDNGRLLIPRGLRKSRLLGFWDPAPGNTKILRVVYTLKGKEQAAEVAGREELRIP